MLKIYKSQIIYIKKESSDNLKFNELKEIEQNINNINKLVCIAAKNSNRNINDIKIIAVTKTIDLDRIKFLITKEMFLLGENKVQEILEKYDKINNFNNHIKWHFIGHLQTNKIKYIIDKVCMIHSVDSIKVAEEIDKRAKKMNTIIDILIQINVAKENSKFGIMPEQCEDFFIKISKFNNINVKGLMTVAPFTNNPESNRIYFRKLKKIMIDINNKNINNINMSELSMGMTNDFHIAIEEGATIIRIGTGLFGNRIYNN